MRVVTSDLPEAIAAVSSVYCPHDVKVLESNRGIDAVLEAFAGSRQQMVSLRYSAPVKIDAGQFENLLLFMTCVDGSAKATQGSSAVQWQKGKTLPLSPNLPSRLMFDRRFWQNSIRLDKAFVEDFCSRLLNRPIDHPIRFELTPFSQALELAWQQAINRPVRPVRRSGSVIGDAAAAGRVHGCLGTRGAPPQLFGAFEKRKDAL
jgi:hypothetical protein